MKNHNVKVDQFLKAAKKWNDEMALLREIALDSGLSEDFKWSLPCYTHDESNIAIIQNFKDSCALMFFNGASLKDPKKLLKSVGPNSHIAKRLEYKDIREISKQKAAIKSLIKEAIAFEKSEEKPKVKQKKAPNQEMPAEFEKALKQNKALKTAFGALTPGRQRMYLMFFAGAKKAETREARIKKYIPTILKGLGMND